MECKRWRRPPLARVADGSKSTGWQRWKAPLIGPRLLPNLSVKRDCCKSPPMWPPRSAAQWRLSGRRAAIDLPPARTSSPCDDRVDAFLVAKRAVSRLHGQACMMRLLAKQSPVHGPRAVANPAIVLRFATSEGRCKTNPRPLALPRVSAPFRWQRVSHAHARPRGG